MKEKPDHPKHNAIVGYDTGWIVEEFKRQFLRVLASTKPPIQYKPLIYPFQKQEI